MPRNLFSSTVSRIVSVKWKVKEGVESSAGGSKLERNESVNIYDLHSRLYSKVPSVWLTT
jgi:hypothetical protein